LRIIKFSHIESNKGRKEGRGTKGEGGVGEGGLDKNEEEKLCNPKNGRKLSTGQKT